MTVPGGPRCSPGRAAVWTAAVLGATAVGGAQLLHWLAARSGRHVPAEGRRVVVVLGVPDTNPVYRAVRRWRVSLALDAVRRWAPDRVIFTGGYTGPGPSEAAGMAAVARARGLDPGLVVLEERSLTTRQNVAEAARLAGDAAVVVLVSDALHAARARSDWQALAGAAAPRFVLADHYRPFDRVLLRTPMTVTEVLYRVLGLAERRNDPVRRPDSDGRPGPRR